MGKGLLEKEGVIKRIELFGNDSDRIRIVVKSSFEGRASSYHHAMLNIDDDLFVSLERYHSIITTFQDLSEHLHKNVNLQNIESVYRNAITFSIYGIDVRTALQEIAEITHSFRKPQSRTIYRNKLRVDYDWVYLSGLYLSDDEENEKDYKKKIIKFLRNNLRKKYKIGNFRSQAMKLTRLSDIESKGIDKAIEEDNFGYWTYHNPRKLIYLHRLNKDSDYSFIHNYWIIADGVFCRFENLERITIPNSVKYIGNDCFNGCPKLTDIHLPTKLVSIGMLCFANCTSLQHIIIPNSVTEIESLAFQHCESLQEIVMSDNLKHIGWNVFEGCHNKLCIIINEAFEEELRAVLHAYTEHIVVVDSDIIKRIRETN